MKRHPLSPIILILGLVAAVAFGAPPAKKHRHVGAALNTATLSWVAPTTNADGTPIVGTLTYNVYQGAMNAVTLVASGVASSPYVVSTGLTPGTTQCFAVAAVETVAANVPPTTTSPQSAEVCKVIPAATPASETADPPTTITLTTP